MGKAEVLGAALEISEGLGSVVLLITAAPGSLKLMPGRGVMMVILRALAGAAFSLPKGNERQR